MRKEGSDQRGASALGLKADPRIGYVLPLPLSLVLGGREIQALRSLEAVRALGVRAEPFDSWSEDSYALLHCFGAEPPLWELIETAHAQGVKIVVSAVLVFPGRLRHRLWKLIDPLVPVRTSFRMRRRLLSASDIVIALTATEAKRLTDVFDVEPTRIVVIPNGVDDRFLRATSEVIRRQLGPEPFVLCVGAIEPRKGQLDALAGAERANRKIVFIGRRREIGDGYGDEFESRVAASRHAVWLGYLEPMSSLLESAYAAAEGLVLMSRAEGLPLVALEAQAAGCPLILSSLPEHRDAFGSTATYVPAGDTAKLAQAIARLPHRGLGRPSGSVKPPTWQGVAEALASVYDRLLTDVGR